MNIWIYQIDRQLKDEEKAALSSDLNEFIERWSAHGKKLKAEFEIPYNHFIVLKVDESQALASGCSIDDSVRFVKTLESKYKLSLFDRMKMAYIKEGDVKLAPLQSIHSLFNSGEISADTVVFDNTISKEEEFPSAWQVPIKDTAYMNFA